jgi:hypothetical protein
MPAPCAVCARALPARRAPVCGCRGKLVPTPSTNGLRHDGKYNRDRPLSGTQLYRHDRLDALKAVRHRRGRLLHWREAGAPVPTWKKARVEARGQPHQLHQAGHRRLYDESLRYCLNTWTASAFAPAPAADWLI